MLDLLSRVPLLSSQTKIFDGIQREKEKITLVGGRSPRNVHGLFKSWKSRIASSAHISLQARAKLLTHICTHARAKRIVLINLSKLRAIVSHIHKILQIYLTFSLILFLIIFLKIFFTKLLASILNNCCQNMAICCNNNLSTSIQIR